MNDYQKASRDVAICTAMIRRHIEVSGHVGKGLQESFLACRDRLQAERKALGADEPRIGEPIRTAGFVLTATSMGIEVEITDRQAAGVLCAQWEAEEPSASSCARIEEAAHVRVALGGEKER